MRRIRRAVLGAIAGLMLLATCTGCGTEKSQETATEKPQETVTAEEAKAETGTAGEVSKQSEVGFYLDTVITLTAYTADAQVLKDAMAECGRYEQLLSRTIEGSDVWRINHAEGKDVEVSEDTIAILACAREISEKSSGAFDATIAPVSTMWDFTSGAAVLPDAEKIARAAMLVDWTKVRIDGNTVTLPAGMMIDLGGIAKGYIADRVKAWLEEQGVEHAILSFGGNIVAIGKKPDGTEWKVGIQDIDKATGAYMLVVRNEGGSTVTSGIYERGFELDGVRYHHLLSPQTGWPAQNELASVTILSESSMEGDALATAAFVLGTEVGLKLIESLEGIEAIFIARDRSITYSSGAKDYVVE